MEVNGKIDKSLKVTLMGVGVKSPASSSLPKWFPEPAEVVS
jgi:hypothetical protein